MWLSLLQHLLSVADSLFIALQAAFTSRRPLGEHTMLELRYRALRSRFKGQYAAIWRLKFAPFICFGERSKSFESVYNKYDGLGPLAHDVPSNHFSRSHGTVLYIASARSRVTPIDVLTGLTSALPMLRIAPRLPKPARQSRTNHERATQ